VDLKCFGANKNHISTWCYSDPSHSPWILSCVYGPPAISDKQAFWDWFTFVGTNFDAPWLCIGDFNSVLSQSEKLLLTTLQPETSKVLLILGLLETNLPSAIIGRGLLLLKKDLIEAWPLKGGFSFILIFPFSIFLHVTQTTTSFPSIPTTTPLTSIDLLGLRNFGTMMPLVEKLLRRPRILLCVEIPPSISLKILKTLSLPCYLRILLILATFRRKSSSLFNSLILSSKPILVLLLLIRS
jgi:hypothetical protein